MDSQFLKDVKQGLTASPKYLSSQYFYDKKGDAIFQQIMAMEEYYLTDSEFEIFESDRQELLDLFSKEGGQPFRLIEFGAGDGTKTKILLRHFLDRGAEFTYMPIDISGNVIDLLTNDLKDNMPELKVEGIKDEYFSALARLSADSDKRRKVILFLGSNIGNFKHDKAISFLKEMNQNLNPDDLVLIGFDLKKDPRVILAAYNDAKGITRSFNINLLERMNAELDTDFDTSKFRHSPVYDPMSGETKSYLVSTEDQEVQLDGESIRFEAWEPIYMEISQKYALKDIQMLADRSGFGVRKNFYDSRRYYVDSAWVKN